MTDRTLGVGCPMWANRDWVGTYLPSDTPVGRELEPYSLVCNAVEGNTTFYAIPDVAVVERWAASTPDDFRFCFKLPREISHDRRLRDTDGPLGEFLDRMAPLGSRLGPFMIQLPGSFGPDDLAALATFVERLPSGFRWAVEVRHPAFHAGGDAERPLNDLLHSHAINRILFDSRPVFAGPRVTPEEIDAWEKKPRLPVRAVATADEPIVRFIGQTEPDANPAYWAPWVDRVVRWIEDGRRPIVFLHTPDNRVSPELCRRFHAEVAARTTVARLSTMPSVAVQQRFD